MKPVTKIFNEIVKTPPKKKNPAVVTPPMDRPNFVFAFFCKIQHNFPKEKKERVSDVDCEGHVDALH